MSVESNGDGSDVFWPGYVDAVTNLVLNLLFLLTIMTVAVFIFAMELGKNQKSDQTAPLPTENAQATAIDAPVPDKLEELDSLRKQIEVLKKEVKVANDARNAQNDARNAQKVVSASVTVAKPTPSLELATPISGGGIVVQYLDEAISLTAAETEKLRSALAPVVGSGGARVEVVVPKGFSEAKRLGFYRTMAIRNLLIEMKLPATQIEVTVKEGPSNSNASVVSVTPRKP